MLKAGIAPWPSYTQAEADAVQRVLLSNKVNYWTGGECRAFEREFAEWVGAAHAVALANGTLALDVALRALGVGAGDEVVVTPRTFIASASCIAEVGARPVFADIDRDSQNITAETIASVLTSRTKAIICVHLAGLPCDMDPILTLADRHDLYVIEDCAQAHGAFYKGRPVGSLGHIAAWSFCQDKIMTTGGEGGMVTTNQTDLWSRMWSYKDHGKSWQAVYERGHPPGFRWLHESFGSNYRLTEMQAAIGRIQLQCLLYWNAKRRHNAELILDACAAFPSLRVPRPPADIIHAYYKAYVFVQPDALKEGWDRDRISQEIAASGVPCLAGSCSEVYLEKAFEGTGWRPSERLPVARELGETSLMFQVHPTLTEDDVQRSCEAVSQVMARAQR